MTSPPRTQHGYSDTSRTQLGYTHPSAAESRLPASGTEHSLVTPRNPRSSARKFTDPHEVTWWVHLVRLKAVVLRFQNGAHARYLHPVPSDWRECDEPTLWRYCEQAMP